MDNQQNTCARRCRGGGNMGGFGGGIYGLGLIGALVYFLQGSAGFWAIVLGILKALVWPALLVYKLFIFLR